MKNETYDTLLKIATAVVGRYPRNHSFDALDLAQQLAMEWLQQHPPQGDVPIDEDSLRFMFVRARNIYIDHSRPAYHRRRVHGTAPLEGRAARGDENQPLDNADEETFVIAALSSEFEDMYEAGAFGDRIHAQGMRLLHGEPVDAGGEAARKAVTRARGYLREIRCRLQSKRTLAGAALAFSRDPSVPAYEAFVREAPLQLKEHARLLGLSSLMAEADHSFGCRAKTDLLHFVRREADGILRYAGMNTWIRGLAWFRVATALGELRRSGVSQEEVFAAYQQAAAVEARRGYRSTLSMFVTMRADITQVTGDITTVAFLRGLATKLRDDVPPPPSKRLPLLVATLCCRKTLSLLAAGRL